VNVVEAKPKDHVPYGERQQLLLKEGVAGRGNTNDAIYDMKP